MPKIPPIYSERFDIPCYMFDCSTALRPHAVMDIAQELAAKGSKQIGATDADLAPHGLVWILARMRVHFYDAPHRLDSVTAQTWHRGLQGPFFLRDYSLLGEDGATRVGATSSWVLMDVEKRSLLRGDHAQEIVPSGAQNSAAAISGPQNTAEKVAVPKEVVMEKAGEHTVSYSDLDYNGHANNAKYVLWASDVLPVEMLRERGVSDFTVNFNREAHLGDTLQLLWGASSDVFFIEGRFADGAQAFVCKFVF